jgi:hypothetical protein
MTTHASRYKAFLLRIWQVENDGKLIWHASLEDSHTNERQGFSSLDALFEFLKGETGEKDVRCGRLNDIPKS